MYWRLRVNWRVKDVIENLQKLYNTMLLIETKGDSTKTMADCLRFIEKMITDVEQPEINVDSAENEIVE